MLGGFAGDTTSRQLNVLWAKLAQQIGLEDARFDGVKGVAIVDLTDDPGWTLRASSRKPGVLVHLAGAASAKPAAAHACTAAHCRLRFRLCPVCPRGKGGIFLS
jgi:hypothetical protein